jgi:preprotein translocase subunit SecD
MSGTINSGEMSDPNTPLIACSQDGYYKYILGPVMIDGSRIDRAQAGKDTGGSGQWVVNLSLTSTGGISQNGAEQFKIITTKLATQTEPLNQFAIVLDDMVVSAPKVNEAIPNGSAQISGQFTQATANMLADQLNFGSLPIDFKVQSEDNVSATLGSEQLDKGLLAGIIGLILVGLYSFLQYRVLGFVTITSLAISAAVTFAAIIILSNTQGYRLSLAGVTGIIVSIGITADSFIVYFERVKDEIRNGRDLSYSVDVGWDRAKRTILASDAINFIAAFVLYFVSVGGVRGFAFTLGLTTIVDVLVVFFYTHPLITLLTRTKFFGLGNPASGLDPYLLGAPNALPYKERLAEYDEKKQAAAAQKALLNADKTARTTKSSKKRGLPDIKPLEKTAETAGLSIAERKALARKQQLAAASGGDKSRTDTKNSQTKPEQPEKESNEN